MTGFVRGALAVTAGLALLAAPTMAAVPSPANSAVDPVAVGNASGNPLKGGGFGTAILGVGFTVVVNDIGGNPVPGAVVTVNFATANGNNGAAGAAVVNPFNTQVGGTTVDCGTLTLSQVANGSGVAVFQPLFGGAENDASIEVRANGVLLSLIQARSTDASGNGTTDLPDLAVFQTNLFGVGGLDSDFDLGGTVNLPDLAILQTEIFSGASRTNC